MSHEKARRTRKVRLNKLVQSKKSYTCQYRREFARDKFKKGRLFFEYGIHLLTIFETRYSVWCFDDCGKSSL